MIYPIAMQVHVIWHPESDALCRPLGEMVYVALNRDPYQPLLPGIGIPVFFRCAGIEPGVRSGPPRPIRTPDTKFDLRIALVTSDLVMDPAWERFLQDSEAEVGKHPGTAALIVFDLSGGVVEGDRLAVRLDPKDPRVRERFMQHVLLQCCRMLGGRERGSADSGRGAAPLKLFISHTKRHVAGAADTSRDPDGLLIAKAVKRYLDTLAVDRFFDEVSIQPGDSLSKELEAEIQDSALVCVRTDNYVSSPWCRKELKLAKENRRPMVVFDALTLREPRSSSLLSNLPSIRLAADDLEDEARLESAVNFVALEVVRFLYTNKQLSLLQEAGLVPADAILLTRPPEVRDLRAIIESAGKSLSSRPLLLHPDPTLSAEEADELEALGAEFATPTGLWKKRLDGLRLGLSLSPGDPAERDALGLGLHVEDAMRVIARQALAAGARLYYGGTLEEGSLTQALFDMIGAYNRDGLKMPSLVNYTPWPWFEEVDKTWLARRLNMLTMKPCQPPDDALKLAAGSGRGHVGRLNATAEGRYALGRSLTAMRQAITTNTDARVVLGGKPHAFMGFLPGIVEEVVLALRAGMPVYILGGFGGAAHLVVEALEGRRPVELTREYQGRISPAYEETLKFYDDMRARSPELLLPTIDYAEVVRELETSGVSALANRNGLDEAENRFLFTTASVDAALHLIMKGLTKLIPEKPPSDH